MKTLKITLIPILISAAFTAKAQSLITPYNFERVGEFHMANPAAYQPYRAVVGLPGLGGLNVYVHNSSFDIAQVMSSELTANESVEYILDNFNIGDRLLVDQVSDIMFVGFRTGKGYWSLGVQARNQVSFQYPVQLFNLAYYGSVGVNGQISMSDYYTEVNSYLSYHLGYQHELMEGKMRIGGRFKYLSGLAHASTPKVDFDATLNSDEWSFVTDIEARVGTAIPTDDFSLNSPTSVLFSDNNGYAFDLGVSYEVIPGLELSASAIDIGSITWRSNTTVYRSNGQYTWDGQDYSYPSESGEFNADTILQEIIDAVEFQESDGEEFTVALPRSFMLGARYNITAKHGFGATYQLNQWGPRTYNSMGVSYIGNWSKWFSFYANYTMIEADNMNVGVGFSANLGPIQLYLFTDDVLVATFENVNMANIRFGMNVALYRKDLRGYSETASEETKPVDIVTPPMESGNSGEGAEEAEEEDNN